MGDKKNQDNSRNSENYNYNDGGAPWQQNQWNNYTNNRDNVRRSNNNNSRITQGSGNTNQPIGKRRGRRVTTESRSNNSRKSDNQNYNNYNDERSYKQPHQQPQKFKFIKLRDPDHRANDFTEDLRRLHNRRHLHSVTLKTKNISQWNEQPANAHSNIIKETSASDRNLTTENPHTNLPKDYIKREKKEMVANPNPRNSIRKFSSSPESDSGSDAKKGTSKTLKEQQTTKVTPTEEGTKGSSADVICLGSLKRKYVISDNSDESELNEKALQTKINKSAKVTDSTNSDQCGICGINNHTSFQCQMICMNCSEPYHSLKDCPKTSNLSIMLLKFMEFCMLQLQNFNPILPFEAPTHQRGAQPTNVSSLNKRKKKNEKKKKSKSKKLSGKSAKIESSSTTDEELVENDEDKSSESDDKDSASETGTEESEVQINATKRKRKNSGKTQKTKHKQQSAKQPYFQYAPSTGVTPFLAQTAHFNPLLFTNMLQNVFPGVPSFKN